MHACMHACMHTYISIYIYVCMYLCFVETTSFISSAGSGSTTWQHPGPCVLGGSWHSLNYKHSYKYSYNWLVFTNTVMSPLMSTVITGKYPEPPSNRKHLPSTCGECAAPSTQLYAAYSSDPWKTLSTGVLNQGPTLSLNYQK